MTLLSGAGSVRSLRFVSVMGFGEYLRFSDVKDGEIIISVYIAYTKRKDLILGQNDQGEERRQLIGWNGQISLI